jgi:hypothetical protein
MVNLNIGWQGIVAVAALLLSAYNTFRQHREHRWRQEDREAEQKRRVWCLEAVAALRKIAVPLEVHDTQREWALWGEKNGYFLVKRSERGTMELHAAEGQAWIDRELIEMLR